MRDGQQDAPLYTTRVIAAVPGPPARSRKVLLVGYYFPPLGGGGALRTFNVVKSLAERGVDVSVVTTHPWTRNRDDQSLVDRLPPNVEVARTHSWDPYHLRAHLGSGGAEPPLTKAVGTSRLLSSLLRFFIVPSPTVGWRGPALKAARRWIREKGIDVVLTTQPPITSHLIGWELARTEGVRWVAEYRDIWVDIYYDGPPTPLHRAWYRSIERRMLRRADRVVTVAESISARIEGTNPGARVFTIPNGFDPHELREAPTTTLPPQSLLYLGTVVDGCEPALMALIDVLASMERGPQLFHVGDGSKHVLATLRNHARAAGFDDRFHSLGFKPHAEAIGYAKGATGVVVSGYPVSPYGLSGKLCEYLGAGRPILGILERGTVAFTDRLIESSGGAVASMHDRARMTEAVRHVLRAGAEPRPILPEASTPLQWPNLAARYEEILFG